jgi:hypothetical protein
MLSRSLRLATLALVALVQITAASLQAADKTACTVNLTTPWKVGQTYGITTDSSETMHSRLAMSDKPGTPLKDQTQKRSVHMEADAQALAVFENGGLKKAAFTVKALRATLDGQPEREILPAGAKVVAESTGTDEKTYTVNGQPAATDVEAILKMAISLDTAEHNDQIIFGPKKPVAVGDSWQPETAVILQTIGKSLGAAASTTAVMKLNAVRGEGADQVADISGNVTMTGLKPPLPPQFTTKVGTFQAQLEGSIPATRHGKRTEKLDASLHFVSEAAGPGGAAMVVTVDGTNKNVTVLVFP